jgi:hypothetical protein
MQKRDSVPGREATIRIMKVDKEELVFHDTVSSQPITVLDTCILYPSP